MKSFHLTGKPPAATHHQCIQPSILDLPSTPDSVLVISSSEGDKEMVGILASVLNTPKPPGMWVGMPAASGQNSL